MHPSPLQRQYTHLWDHHTAEYKVGSVLYRRQTPALATAFMLWVDLQVFVSPKIAACAPEAPGFAAGSVSFIKCVAINDLGIGLA